MTEPLMGNQRIPPKLWLNAKQFTDTYEITPAQYTHVKALSGDKSDGYESIKGLGDTFALKLIQQYGSIEEVEKNLDTLKIPRLSQKVVDLLKKEYATIYHNFKLANLNHSPETELEIFGQAGIDYLDQCIADLEVPNEIDRKYIEEYCFENGKVSVVDRLDMWLVPFISK